MVRKFRVIVADDEKLIAKNISRNIEKANDAFHVISLVGDGLEAYEMTQKLLPDAVFSDVKMPGMNGIELIEKLNIEFPSIKKVIISGYNDFDLARSAIRSKALDYLLKPVNPNDLKLTLHKLETELLAAQNEFTPRRGDSPAEIVEIVMAYIRHNYADQVVFSDISDKYNFSSAYLSKIFKEHTNTSPGKYLIDYRLKIAKKLLLDSDYSVKDIAERVGFTDPFHFSKSFKKATGLSPAQFREQPNNG